MGGGFAGRFELGGREFRYKAIANSETNYSSARGVFEKRQPKDAKVRRGRVQESGDLASGKLGLSDGKFDYSQSDFSKQFTGYVGLGFDLDREGQHSVDSSFFYTKKKLEMVELRENGYLPGFDYNNVIAKTLSESGVGYVDFKDRATERSWIAGQRAVREFGEDPPSSGPLWYTNFQRSRTLDQERDLLIAQLNGNHEISRLEGLSLRWAANYATTNQKLTARGVRYFFEPDDVSLSNIPSRFPVRVEDLGPGRFAANNKILFSNNEVTETQGFGRFDFDYETDLHENVQLELSTGGWFELSKRHVAASFLESPTVGGTSQFAILGDTPLDLGINVFEQLDHTVDGKISGLRASESKAEREIESVHASLEGTLFEDLDLIAGVRVEQIKITARNNPFTGEETFGAPQTFPSVYLFFDRLDNRTRGEVTRAPPDATTFNDQLLGIDVPIDPDTGLVDLPDRKSIDRFVNGRINEMKYLPAVSVAYRPLDGVNLRASYSETVARPSLRELGFYVDVEPGKDDLVVGNPQLGLSDVRSIDVRAEYFWGDLGELIAVSYFEKKIENPIEKIVFRNPLNFEDSGSAIFRSFFNNPNNAKLWGIEVESRKTLDLFGWDFGKYISVGGNYTWIDAKVGRVDVEGPRVESFFLTADGEGAAFNGLRTSRRLFGQPQWIANADLTFDNPDWGTKLTIAYFAISDVLDAAGSVFLRANGAVGSYTPDRYVDSFHTLDLNVSQSFEPNLLRGSISVGFSAKNLTNSVRRIVYDRKQTAGRISERSFRVGRDFSLSLSYTF